MFYPWASHVMHEQSINIITQILDLTTCLCLTMATGLSMVMLVVHLQGFSYNIYNNHEIAASIFPTKVTEKDVFSECFSS